MDELSQELDEGGAPFAEGVVQICRRGLGLNACLSLTAIWDKKYFLKVIPNFSINQEDGILDVLFHICKKGIPLSLQEAITKVISKKELILIIDGPPNSRL